MSQFPIIWPALSAFCVHVYVAFLLPFYLFQSWWSSCQTCSCLMMMGTYSIRPAANRKLEGQKEGFIWEGRPSCYRHANRSHSTVPGVLQPDNVPSYSTLTLHEWDRPDTLRDCPPPPKSHSTKKLFFTQQFTGMFPPASHISHILSQIIHFCHFKTLH